MECSVDIRTGYVNEWVNIRGGCRLAGCGGSAQVVMQRAGTEPNSLLLTVSARTGVLLCLCVQSSENNATAVVRRYISRVKQLESRSVGGLSSPSMYDDATSHSLIQRRLFHLTLQTSANSWSPLGRLFDVWYVVRSDGTYLHCRTRVYPPACPGAVQAEAPFPSVSGYK